MNNHLPIAIAKTLHKNDVKAYWELNLTDLKGRLESVSNPVKRQKLLRAIADAEFRICEIEFMEGLTVGSWVKSQISSKPGKISSLGYAGKVPQAQVQWWGATVPVPERPLNLTVLTDDQMVYQWNHDKFPKLVRRFDGLECKDIQVLTLSLKEAEGYLIQADSGDRKRDYQLQVTYCNKRIAYLKGKPTDCILISDIKRNGGTQQRITLNQEVVIEYAEAMRQGDKFPPVKLTYDGINYWLTDGFHTTEAAWSIGLVDIKAIVTNGSQRDAILSSVSVNSDHGLRRSNADKRLAVTTLLEDQQWGMWSDREISRRCKVHHSTVAKIRACLTGDLASDNPKKYIDKHGNESIMNTQNIGSDNKLSFLTDKLINDNSCPDNSQAVQTSCLNKAFTTGQIVRIKSDRSDKRLIGYHMTVAVITQINPASVDLKIWGQSITNVSPNDLEILDQEKLPSLCFCPSLEDYRKVLTGFDSPEEMMKAAIRTT
jgi:hypothetical protein